MNSFYSALLLIPLLISGFQAQASDETPLATYQALKPELASKLAWATLKACRKAGYQTSVAVVDRFGNIQVLLRDQLAGMHSPEVATRKAWTAASFKSATDVMMHETQAGKVQSGVRFASNAMMVAGGIPVEVGGVLVGALGVSGAPGGDKDQECAMKGLAAIEDDLPL